MIPLLCVKVYIRERKFSFRLKPWLNDIFHSFIYHDIYEGQRNIIVVERIRSRVENFTWFRETRWRSPLIACTGNKGLTVADIARYAIAPLFLKSFTCHASSLKGIKLIYAHFGWHIVFFPFYENRVNMRYTNCKIKTGRETERDIRYTESELIDRIMRFHYIRIVHFIYSRNRIIN